MIVTMGSRRGLADLAKKTAHWGIKGQGELPKIMGVLEFGDPDHTWPNTPKGSRLRKMLELNAVIGNEDNPSEIPPRPWLRRSIEGEYRKRLVKYVNTELPKVLRSMPKTGQGVYTPRSKKLVKEFIDGLADTGRDNAELSWERANFTPNAPATLELKDDPRPLHGNGNGEHPMSGEAITSWSD